MYSLPVLALLLPNLAVALASQSIYSVAGRAEAGYRNVAYFANWAVYGRNFHPQNLTADILTHVIYAFASIHPDTGEVYLSDAWSDTQRRYPTDSWNDATSPNVYGCIKQLYLQKKRNRRMKTLLSIGGWTYSANFAQPASTAAGRSMFASSAVQLLQDLGFDGIDIDWEFPQDAAQASDLVSLLAETRKQLDVYSEQYAPGHHLLLTVASSAAGSQDPGPANYKKLDLIAMDKYLDFWNIMTYDYAGAELAGHNANWQSSTSNPRSTPFNSNSVITDYANAGISASKIVVGMPLYGRSFANTAGPGQPFSGVGKGTWEPGVYDYKSLAPSAATMNTDDTIAAAWTYDPAQRLMISFDTPSVINRKVDQIKARGLGGAMWWESSSDKDGVDSLIQTFAMNIGGISTLEQSQNLLNYSTSQYENLKAGMPGE